jgi:hypothetical protein
MPETTYEPIPDDLNDPLTKGDLFLFRQEISERIGNLPTKELFSQLQNSVDALTGQVRTYNTERSAETHRLKRLEDWAKEASKRINIPFEL